MSEWSTILSSFGLHQLVSSPTHKKGHILDPVISSHKVVDHNSVEVMQNMVKSFPSCDHYPILFQLHKPPDIDKCEKVIVIVIVLCLQYVLKGYPRKFLELLAGTPPHLTLNQVSYHSAESTEEIT